MGKGVTGAAPGFTVPGTTAPGSSAQSTSALAVTAVGAIALGAWVGVYPASLPVLFAGTALVLIVVTVTTASDARRAGLLSMCALIPGTTMTGVGAAGPITVSEVVPILILGVTYLPGVAASSQTATSGVQRWGLQILSVMVVGGWIATLAGNSSFIPPAAFTLTTLPLILAAMRLNPSMAETQWLLMALVAGILGSTALGVTGFTEPNGRAVGVTHHPNQFAMQIALCLPLLWLLWKRGRIPSLLAAAALGLLLFGMLESGSRSGVLALIFVFLLWALRAGHAVVAACMAVLAACVVGLGAMPSLDTPTTSRLLDSQLTANSNLEREALMSEGLARLRENPILGYGIPRTDLPHNVFLLFWGGTGLFGLIAFLILLYRIGTIILLEPVNHDRWALALGAGGFFVAVSLNNSIGTPTAWFVLGLLQVSYLTSRADHWPGRRSNPAQHAPVHVPQQATASHLATQKIES